MSISDMKRALEAFEEDGAVQERYIGANNSFRWCTTRHPSWNFFAMEYRPIPKPREWWLNVYSGDVTAHHNKVAADAAADAMRRINCIRLECIHVREVLEDE